MNHVSLMTGEDIGFHTQYPEAPLSIFYFFCSPIQPNTCSDINTTLSNNSTIEIKHNKTVQDKVTLLSDLRDSSSHTGNMNLSHRVESSLTLSQEEYCICNYV